jgi:hypothetical protein
MNNLKQHEQVIEVMEENNGYSTLGKLYRLVDVSNWKTKTPFASIRRIVQDERFFFKIRPGLWGLKSHRNDVLENFLINVKSLNKDTDEFDHTYYQGLLVEIGNMEGFGTYVPNQDKNKLFLSKPLHEYSTIQIIYKFTFDEILKKASTIDVSWFNERNFPNSFFEVEHSTDIQNSLLKFLSLQDFNTKFNIVADKKREKEFSNKIISSAFNSIKNRTKFVDYGSLASYHAKLSEILVLKNSFYK